MEYAGTVTVNPLTALRILQDFVKLNPGALPLASPIFASCYFLPSKSTHHLQSPLSGDAIVQKGATSIVVQCVIQLAKVHGIHTINIIRDR